MKNVNLVLILHNDSLRLSLKIVTSSYCYKIMLFSALLNSSIP